ncbi:hypothetical protein EMCRGX_G021762 [Ephydatia muelleri]
MRAFVLACAFLWALGEAKLEATQFINIKPSGQLTHEKLKLENNVICIFTYSAVGGTNEEWSMDLKQIKKKMYTCTIERPGEQSSYLYFKSFAASILDHTIDSAEVFDSKGALLQNEEFIVDDKGGSVKHKDGGFRSNLAKIVFTATKK